MAEQTFRVARLAVEIPESNKSYMLPWRIEMLYEIEPTLKEIAKTAISNKRRRFDSRIEAYVVAKESSWPLVGWCARDPRLRSSEAWDCFFDYILDALHL